MRHLFCAFLSLICVSRLPCTGLMGLIRVKAAAVGLPTPRVMKSATSCRISRGIVHEPGFDRLASDAADVFWWVHR